MYQLEHHTGAIIIVLRSGQVLWETQGSEDPATGTSGEFLDKKVSEASFEGLLGAGQDLRLQTFDAQALLNHPAWGDYSILCFALELRFEEEVESHDMPVLEYLRRACVEKCTECVRTIEAEDLDKEDSDKGFRHLSQLSFGMGEGFCATLLRIPTSPTAAFRKSCSEKVQLMPAHVSGTTWKSPIATTER